MLMVKGSGIDSRKFGKLKKIKLGKRFVSHHPTPKHS